MIDFKQYELVPNQEQQNNDFTSAGNIARTDKDLNVKDSFIHTDVETKMLRGQKFRRTAISTLIFGSVYSVSSSEFLLAITSLSYAPTIGLPRPTIVGEGKTFIVKDEVGGAATTTITIRSAGEENIDGVSTSTITTNYGLREFYTDGANWFTK